MLVMGVTFVFFMAEALLHYQLGAWQDDGPIQFPQWTWPDKKDLVSIVAIVGIFSYLSAKVIDYYGAQSTKI
mgnify:CR=1 FL=1|jgi:hypothetical protein|tara:strand:- start:201 stop:416 length:216 start_codon:yes stop_codon:yes gene_type:complete